MGYGLWSSPVCCGWKFLFSPRKFWRGKVYTVQNDAFAICSGAMGDSECAGRREKHALVATALVMPLLERYNNRLFFDFLRVLRLDSLVLQSILGLIRIKDIRNYIFKNFCFEVPLLRRLAVFSKDARKIVPQATIEKIWIWAKGFGGSKSPAD